MAAEKHFQMILTIQTHNKFNLYLFICGGQFMLQ